MRVVWTCMKAREVEEDRYSKDFGELWVRTVHTCVREWEWLGRAGKDQELLAQ